MIFFILMALSLTGLKLEKEDPLLTVYLFLAIVFFFGFLEVIIYSMNVERLRGENEQARKSDQYVNAKFFQIGLMMGILAAGLNLGLPKLSKAFFDTPVNSIQIVSNAIIVVAIIVIFAVAIDSIMKLIRD